eukprot:9694714-Alexandrium_andersonii.AAC.1
MSRNPPSATPASGLPAWRFNARPLLRYAELRARASCGGYRHSVATARQQATAEASCSAATE